ncbi:MAG TPA: hypothetical protein DEB05_07340 [Firmicutes bacterium]|jgi:hypothetical protein|nr:hypothetical protein [Bacillota bacterium]HBT16753.1 hypothetical protein [Bacillota bacterium]
MVCKEEIFANKIFLNSVLPLLKVLAEERGELKKSFKNKTAVIQISAKDLEGKVATHFDIKDGVWTVGKGTVENSNLDLELEFSSIVQLNDFFTGKTKKLPKIKGLRNIGLLAGALKALMAMSKLLGASSPPKKEEEKELLVKMYFYLLSSGISQLNKAGHPDISNWTKKSPDRVFAWAVTGKPELSAYLRVKAGNSKAGRGEYKRSKPFFTMRFDTVDSALGILLQIDDMIDATINERIIMEGAPEYGAQIGEYMVLVGSYAKGEYKKG